MNESRTNDDMQIIHLITGKILHETYGIKSVPRPADYRLSEKVRSSHRETQITVAVRVAPRLLVTVGHDWEPEGMKPGDLVETAEWLAEAVADMHRDRRDIVELLAEVRSAVRREIAKAKRRGIKYRLMGLELRGPHNVSHSGVVIEVSVERLDEALRSRPTSFQVECEDDLVEQFASWNEDQAIRTSYREILDRNNSTGMIDRVVVSALQDAGHDLPHILRRLADEDDWIVDVGRGTDTAFRLYWKAGRVYSHLRFREGVVWNEGTLSFDSMPAIPTRLAGKSLRTVVALPSIPEEVIINSTFGKKGERGSLACSNDLLHFDARTGRIWAA